MWSNILFMMSVPCSGPLCTGEVLLYTDHRTICIHGRRPRQSWFYIDWELNTCLLKTTTQKLKATTKTAEKSRGNMLNTWLCRGCWFPEKEKHNSNVCFELFQRKTLYKYLLLLLYGSLVQWWAPWNVKRAFRYILRVFNSRSR